MPPSKCQKNFLQVKLHKRAKEKFSSTLFHVVNKFTTVGGIDVVNKFTTGKAPIAVVKYT